MPIKNRTSAGNLSHVNREKANKTFLECYVYVITYDTDGKTARKFSHVMAIDEETSAAAHEEPQVCFEEYIEQEALWASRMMDVTHGRYDDLIDEDHNAQDERDW